MPKKKNFLGGMQNYNAETGEYEPALVGSNGERPSSFKSFKKEDSEFTKANNKRLGKAREDYEKGKISKGQLDDIAIKGSEEDKARIKAKEQRYLKDFPEDIDRLIELKEKFIGKDYETALDSLARGDAFGDVLNGVVQYEQKEESDDEKDVGKIIKYQPMLNNKGNFDYGEDVRAKKLNNGLAMETKKYSKSHTYFGSNGQYKLVDIESGLIVGWAKDYEEALKKSKDKDFIGAIERARKSYWDRHPERKRTPADPEVIKTADKIRSSGDSYTYQMLDRLRMDVEYVLANRGAIDSLWYDGNPTKHIALMKELHKGLKEKPEWLTMDKINEYEKRFKELED